MDPLSRAGGGFPARMFRPKQSRARILITSQHIPMQWQRRIEVENSFFGGLFYASSSPRCCRLHHSNTTPKAGIGESNVARAMDDMRRGITRSIYNSYSREEGKSVLTHFFRIPLLYPRYNLRRGFSGCVACLEGGDCFGSASLLIRGLEVASTGMGIPAGNAVLEDSETLFCQFSCEINGCTVVLCCSVVV